MRPAELKADQQRQRAADEQEDQAGEQELDADDLVIFGEDVFAQEAQFVAVRPGFMRMANAHARSSLTVNTPGGAGEHSLPLPGTPERGWG